MEERIAHPDKYIDEGKSSPSEAEDPNLYRNVLLSDK